MQTGFIGAGKAGFTLGKYFAVNGIELSGYYSRSRKSAEEAARFAGCTSYEDISELVSDSDVIFITTPDSAIKDTYLKIYRYNISNKQICHCSGAMSAGEAFPEIEQQGAQGFSIHPLFPISSKYESYKEIGRAFFTIEGDSRHIDEWKILFEGMGNPVKILSGEHKTEYHAACAAASNLVCALIAESTELMTKCGFTQKESLKALEPLITANIRGIIKSDPVSALTGPVERCDCETVRRHIRCFEKETDRKIYLSLSLKLTELARKKHPETDYSELEKMLKDEWKRRNSQ